MSQVTTEWHCLVNFFTNFFIFQNLCIRKVGRIGKFDRGLNLLVDQSNKEVTVATKPSSEVTTEKSQDEVDLWCQRFGHASNGMMKRVLAQGSQVIEDRIKQSSIFPSSK